MAGIGLTTALIRQHLTQPVQSTYLISGGVSNDDLTDLNIDVIESATFKINDVTLKYDGGTNIPVPANMNNGKVYLYNNGGNGAIGIGQNAIAESIIIGTFYTDATRIIKYNLSGMFKVINITEELSSKFNDLLIGSTTENINEIAKQCTVSWNEDILIYFLEQKTGNAKVNTILPDSITLNENEIVYATINRNSDVVINIAKDEINNVNLTKNDIVLFYFDDHNRFYTNIKSEKQLINDSAILDWTSNTEYTENQIVIHPSKLTFYRAIQNFTSSINIQNDIDGGKLQAVGGTNGGSGQEVLPYRNEFVIGDWVEDGGLYKLTYTNSQHKQGSNKHIVAFLHDSNNNRIHADYEVTNTGNVIIKSTFNLDGYVIITSFMGSQPIYTNVNPTVRTVGGINTGTTFNNITFAEFIEMLLY